MNKELFADVGGVSIDVLHAGLIVALAVMLVK